MQRRPERSSGSMRRLLRGDRFSEVGPDDRYESRANAVGAGKSGVTAAVTLSRDQDREGLVVGGLVWTCAVMVVPHRSRSPFATLVFGR